jgi:hypothetical protein
MSSKTKALLITATTISLFASVQSADAHHRRFFHFPQFFAPDYGYDTYPQYEGDFGYADPGYANDYADPYYVPRRHKKHRAVERQVDPWWLDAPQPRRLKQARSLEPIPYHKPRAKKTVAAAAPVPKLAPSAVKKKIAPLALAPETKSVVAKPQLDTASLTPVTPKVTKSPAASKAIGCTAGAAIVTGYGFANVTPKSCTGNVYAYNAQRDGKPYVIKVTAAQGEITEVTKQ